MDTHSLSLLQVPPLPVKALLVVVSHLPRGPWIGDVARLRHPTPLLPTVSPPSSLSLSPSLCLNAEEEGGKGGGKEGRGRTGQTHYSW